MNTLEALEYGLANIRECGWCQHYVGDRVSGYCALGALPFDPSPDRLHHYGARKALAARLDTDRPSDWNDTPGRTQAEVEALYEAAIAGEKA